MTLPASGAISLGQVDTELGLSATAQIGMNDSAVRTLFGISSGQISMSDGYGKSSVFTTLSFGALTVGAAVNSTSYGAYSSVTTLTSTLALMAYRDGATGGACLQLINISGTTCTPSTILNVTGSGNVRWCSIKALSSTKAVFTWSNLNVNSGQEEGCVVTISGSTLTAGATVVIDPFCCSYGTQARMTGTQTMVTYQGGPGPYFWLTSHVLDCDLSANTITVGPRYVLNSANMGFNSMDTISPTQAVIAYQNISTGGSMEASVISTSGTAISVGALNYVEPAVKSYQIVTTMTPSKVILINRVAGSGIMDAHIMNVSGTTLSVDAYLNLASYSCMYHAASGLSSTQIVAATRNGATANMEARIISANGNTLTTTAAQSTAYSMHANAYSFMTTLSANKTLLVYASTASNMEMCVITAS